MYCIYNKYGIYHTMILNYNLYAMLSNHRALINHLNLFPPHIFFKMAELKPTQNFHKLIVVKFLHSFEPQQHISIFSQMEATFIL